MFADDTTLVIPGNNEEETTFRTRAVVDQAEAILNQLKLKINQSKTVQLKFSTKQHSNDIEINNLFQRVTHTKFLGILIDENLSWKQHTEQLIKKLSTSLYGIKRIKAISGKETALTAYHALFSSHMRFGIVAWGAAPSTYCI